MNAQRAWLALPVVYMMPGLLQADSAEVKVGSKSFAESVVLGDLVTGLARSTGATAVHAQGIGGTRMLFNALLVGEIDVYPEYTGTISQEILSRSRSDKRKSLIYSIFQRFVFLNEPGEVLKFYFFKKEQEPLQFTSFEQTPVSHTNHN